MFARKAFLIFLLLASPAILMAQESIIPVVYDATENAQATQLTINGTGFGTKQPKVSLGTTQLTVTAYSDSKITANIPAATPAGAYLLDVQNETSRLFTLFTATIGQIGPAGPAGSGASGATYTASFTNPGSGANTTFYASPTITSYGTDIANNSAIATSTQANFITSPVACTVAALNVGVNNYSSPGADTTTIKVFKNGSATSMSCSVTTNGNGAGCTATDSFSVVQGDSLALGFTETNSNPFNMVTVGLVCQ
jgi:hypothetical protein